MGLSTRAATHRHATAKEIIPYESGRLEHRHFAPVVRSAMVALKNKAGADLVYAAGVQRIRRSDYNRVTT